MDQIINLGKGDDIIKVRSQVEWSDGRRVILVIPRGAKAFNSEHELVLVHRWADEADVPVALVSEEYNLRERAAAAGIPIFVSVQKAQHSQWNWKRDGVSPHLRSTALDGLAPLPKKAILDRLGLAGFQLVQTLILFFIAAAILGIAALVLVPSARITIYPASLSVDDTREVILDPTITTIDQVNSILPAVPFRKEISGTATIATTRVDTAPADHSTGAVIFTNLAGAKATIPAGTIVETSSGVTVRFSTTVSAELPAGYNTRVMVPVRAIDAGPAGNVKPLMINTIEGPISAVARVINTDTMKGGSIKQVHLVSFEDKQRLRDQLGAQLRAAAITRIQKSAGAETFVAPASVDISILSETFDHLVDDPSDNLSLHIEAVATGMSVDRVDLSKFGQRILQDKVPKGYVILPGTLDVKTDPNARVEGSSVIFTMQSSLRATPQVNTSQVLKGLTGKTPSQGADLIGSRVKLAEPPVIETSPRWWPWLPLLDFRLALFVQAEPTADSGNSDTP